MTSEEFWGNIDTGKDWIRKEKIKYQDKGNLEAIPEILSWLKDKDFKSVLDIGSGTGRMIGAIHKIYPKLKCQGLDINPELAKYVKKTHGIKVSVGDIYDIPLKDKSFDLVYTYQVLQHTPPDRMEKILKEIKRIAKKEIWLIEGWIDFQRYGYANGAMRHDAGGGTFYWKFDAFFKTYEEGFTQENEAHTECIRYYKIKLADNI